MEFAFSLWGMASITSKDKKKKTVERAKQQVEFRLGF